MNSDKLDYLKTRLPYFFRSFKFEYKITLSYLVFGFLWILFSDNVLDILEPDDSLLTKFQTFKGSFFIVVTSGLLYLLVKRHMRKIRVAESQRIESEFRFTALWENGPFGLVMVNKEFKFKNVNPEFCKILGYGKDELLQFTFKDISHPDDLVKDMPKIRKLIDKEISVYTTEKRYLRKDGQAIWGALTVFPNFDNEGNFLYNLAVIEDITRRKLAEEALRERENKLSTIFNILPVGISILDGEHKVVYENQALENILGITREGIQRGDYRNRKYLRSDGSMKPAEEFASSLVYSEKTAQYNLITGVIKEDGKTIWTNVSAVPVEFPDWKVVLVTADITRQKLIEKELKESEEYLKLGYETANLGIWKNNLETMTVEFDERARMHYGFNESVVSFSDVIARIHPDDTVRWLAEIEKATTKSGSGRYSTEYRVIHPDGSVHWLHIGVRVIFEGEGENLRYVMRYGTSLDITEQKETEEKLRENLNLLRIAGEKAKLGGWSVILGENRAYWSDEVAAIHEMPAGYSPLVEDGMRFYAPEWREKITEVFSRCAEQGVQYDEEMEIITSSGKRIWVRTIGDAVRDENGKIFKVQGAFQDITERKRSEDKIRLLNEKLEQRVAERTNQLEAANKELEAFSYSVSHDLRSPLRHINGFAEILLEDHSEKLPEDARKHLNTITGAAKKMGTLIDDLLSFSRTGRAELKKSTFAMNKVVDDVLAQINPSVINRKIEWRISHLPEIYGDYNLLRQVWVNLLENAVKYTRNRKNTVIEIAFTENDAETVFQIKDNGVGFDMRYVDKLFGVFQRLHSASEFEGTGIGLANVQRIISRHGGKAWAEGEPDKGASFFFSIPK